MTPTPLVEAESRATVTDGPKGYVRVKVGPILLATFRKRGDIAPAEAYAWAFNRGLDHAKTQPIPMVLHCPACGLQHIDVATVAWPNPPHRSHLCDACGHVWRPADVNTAGVQAVSTAGQADSPIATPSQTTGGGEPERLKAVIERDRSNAARLVAAIKKAVDGREHLREPGRGCFAYDDEGYQKEFGDALDEISAAVDGLSTIARDWSDSLSTQEEISAARTLPSPATGGVEPNMPSREVIAAIINAWDDTLNPGGLAFEDIEARLRKDPRALSLFPKGRSEQDQGGEVERLRGHHKNATENWARAEADLTAARLRIKALEEALRPFMPITTHDTPDYAEVTFGPHRSQAMTMVPDDWNKLAAAYEALLSSAQGETKPAVDWVRPPLIDDVGARMLDPSTNRPLPELPCGEQPGATAPATAALAGRPVKRMGRCENKKASSGCQLHNLHCGYPKCDEYPLAPDAAALVEDDQ